MSCFKHLPRIMRSDMIAARLMLSTGALLWAVLLLWPGELFPTQAQMAAGTGRTTYALMTFMPELAWAALFGLHGTFLGLSCFYKVPPWAALLDAFNGAALWTIATGCCYLSNFQGWATYQPPAMGSDVVMCLTSWWWFVRVLADKNYEACH